MAGKEYVEVYGENAPPGKDQVYYKGMGENARDQNTGQNTGTGTYKQKLDKRTKADPGPASQEEIQKAQAKADAWLNSKYGLDQIDDATSIWCPSDLHGPTTNSLWIKMEARGIESMAAWGRADKTLTPRNKRFTFYMLAPNELQEIISHDWGPYESLAASIAEKSAWASRMKSELTNIGKQFEDNPTIKSLVENFRGNNYYSMLKTLYTAIMETHNKAGGWTDLARRMATAASQADVAKTRIDTALVYKNSERRKYDFVFHLADVGTDLRKEIIYPVKLLQFLSSPTKTRTGGTNDLADIDFPFYFTIETYPVDFLKIEYAALTLVEPTYKGPYVDGVPSICELHLSFVEIPPLWDSAFYTKGLITTTSKESQKARDFEKNNWGW